MFKIETNIPKDFIETESVLDIFKKLDVYVSNIINDIKLFEQKDFCDNSFSHTTKYDVENICGLLRSFASIILQFCKQELKIVYIEGNIGIGKSTFLNTLKVPAENIIKEPIDLWVKNIIVYNSEREGDTKPFEQKDFEQKDFEQKDFCDTDKINLLDFYYKALKSKNYCHCFAFQIYVYFTHLLNIFQNIEKRFLLSSRGYSSILEHLSGTEIFVPNKQDQIILSERSIFGVYYQFIEPFKENYGRYFLELENMLLIITTALFSSQYFNIDFVELKYSLNIEEQVDYCMKRINQRNRNEETEKISRDYLIILEQGLDTFFKKLASNNSNTDKASIILDVAVKVPIQIETACVNVDENFVFKTKNSNILKLVQEQN